MQPDSSKITITDNKTKVISLLSDLVLMPRIKALEWSQITLQTPNMRVGYPGQHLASLITGIKGEKTGARGNDLADGSEVKSCSRIDQLDKCLNCGLPVLRIENKCNTCGSVRIKRMNDSKWLFTIRSEKELELLINGIPRIVLILADYPDFAGGDFQTLRFQAFEIWPNSKRNLRFGEIMTNYYKKIYNEHLRINPLKVPAPKNFWPFQYQFYMCNPINTFTCLVKNADTTPEIVIQNYIEPDQDRSSIPSVNMPFNLATESEVDLIGRNFGVSIEAIKSSGITEEHRNVLELRDTDKISHSKTEYRRR